MLFNNCASQLDLTNVKLPRDCGRNYFLDYLRYGGVHCNGNVGVQRLHRIFALYSWANFNGLGSVKLGNVKLSSSNQQGTGGNGTNCSL